MFIVVWEWLRTFTVPHSQKVLNLKKKSRPGSFFVPSLYVGTRNSQSGLSRSNRDVWSPYSTCPPRGLPRGTPTIQRHVLAMNIANDAL